MEMEPPESSCFPQLYWIWMQRPRRATSHPPLVLFSCS